MGRYFSIGEFAAMHNISKQTLIFYDSIGLLKPAHVDKNNGYRYYSAEQLEIMDMITMLKEAGVTLAEMKEFMKSRSPEKAAKMLREKTCQIEHKIARQEKIVRRMSAKLKQLENLKDFTTKTDSRTNIEKINIQNEECRYIIWRKVKKPYSLLEVDLEIKELFEECRNMRIEHNYQVGTIIDRKNIDERNFEETCKVYTQIEKNEYFRLQKEICENMKECEISTDIIKAGLYAVFYHCGEYKRTGETYMKALEFIESEGYEITGNSYEENIIDCLTAVRDKDYVTKFSIPVKKVV